MLSIENSTTLTATFNIDSTEKCRATDAISTFLNGKELTRISCVSWRCYTIYNRSMGWAIQAEKWKSITNAMFSSSEIKSGYPLKRFVSNAIKQSKIEVEFIEPSLFRQAYKVRRTISARSYLSLFATFHSCDKGNLLIHAADRGDTEVIEQLLSNSEPRTFLHSIGEAIHHAAARGYEQILKFLLSTNTQIIKECGNQSHCFGESIPGLLNRQKGYAIRSAAFEGHTTIIEMLLSDDPQFPNPIR